MGKAAQQLEKDLKDAKLVDPKRGGKGGKKKGGRKRGDVAPGGRVQLRHLTLPDLVPLRGNEDALVRVYEYLHGEKPPKIFPADMDKAKFLYEDAEKILARQDAEKQSVPPSTTTECNKERVGCAKNVSFKDLGLPEELQDALDRAGKLDRASLKPIFFQVFGLVPHAAVDDKRVRDVIKTYLIASFNVLAGLTPNPSLLATMEQSMWQVVLNGKKRGKGKGEGRGKQKTPSTLTGEEIKDYTEVLNGMLGLIGRANALESNTQKRDRWTGRWSRWAKVITRERDKVDRFVPKDETPAEA